MCLKNSVLLLFMFLLFPVVFAQDLTHAQQTENWYLISETELQSIEQYKEKSEAERQNWLSQVQYLRARAENSEARSRRLETESGNLNSQLSQARDQHRTLETLFNKYEADQLILISSKNHEIEELKQIVLNKDNTILKRNNAILWLSIVLFIIILTIAGFVLLFSKKVKT